MKTFAAALLATLVASATTRTDSYTANILDIESVGSAVLNLVVDQTDATIVSQIDGKWTLDNATWANAASEQA